MKKIICKVCGKRFAPRKENKYYDREAAGVLQALTAPVKIIECFDCPQCGCQNMLNIRVGAAVIGVDLAKGKDITGYGGVAEYTEVQNEN